MSDGYSIYTLWGELESGEKEPVKIAVAVDFFQEKKWKLIVERKNPIGVLVQRDVTERLTIFEAIDTKSQLAGVYQADGWESADGCTFQSDGFELVMYIDVEVEQENLIPA